MKINNIEVDAREVEFSPEDLEMIMKLHSKLDEPKKDKRWKPEEGKGYFFVDTTSSSKNIEVWKGTFSKIISSCRVNVLIGNYFQTRELAQAHLDYLNAIAEVKDYIYENGYEWEEGEKHFIFFVTTDNCFVPEWYNQNIRYPVVLPYLKSKEACEQLIEAKKESLLIIFK